MSQLSDVLPDFDHRIFYTSVTVHTTRNKASLPYNCQLGKLRLMTDNDKDEFEAAADDTAEQLSEGISLYSLMFLRQITNHLFAMPHLTI